MIQTESTTSPAIPTDLSTGRGSRITHAVLIGAMLLVIGAFFALSFYAHPQTDDFSEATNVRDRGVTQAIVHRYNTWTGRYFYIFVEANFIQNFDLINDFWLVGVTTLILLILSVYAFIHTITRGILSVRQKIGLTLGLIAIHLVLLPSPAHGMYWLTGAVTNQLCMILILFAFALLLRDPTGMSPIKRIALIVTASVCVSASAGCYDTTMLMHNGLLLIATIIAFWARDARRIQFTIALIVGLISGYIVMSAPGNAIRESYFEKASIVQAIDYSITNALKWLVPFVLQPAVLIGSLLFAPTAWLLSRKLREIANGKTRWMLLLVGIWALMIICAWFPAQYIMQGNPPPRTLNPVSMFVLIGVFGSIIVLLTQVADKAGQAFTTPPGIMNVARVGLVIVLLTQGNGNAAIMELKNEAGPFDQAMHARYQMIKEAKENGVAHLTLPRLPAQPTMLMTNDIQTDPESYPNFAKATYWQLDSIVIEEIEEEAQVLSEEAQAPEKGKEPQQQAAIDPVEHR